MRHWNLGILEMLHKIILFCSKMCINKYKYYSTCPIELIRLIQQNYHQLISFMNGFGLGNANLEYISEEGNIYLSMSTEFSSLSL